MIYPLPPKVSKLLPDLLNKGMIQLDLDGEIPIFRASTIMQKRVAILQESSDSNKLLEQEELLCHEEMQAYLSFVEQSLHKISEREQNHLIEQYKICIEMADRVTERRTKISSFYLSVLTGLLVFSSLPYFKDSIVINPSRQITLMTSFTGAFICILWWINIASYKNLNSIKFTVIREMEKNLPYPCFEREWDTKSSNVEKYKKLRKAESFVPIVIAIPFPYLIISLTSIYDLFSLFLNRSR